MINKILCSGKSTLLETLKVINGNGKGIVFVVNNAKQVQGVLTDGDIRRLLLKGLSLKEKIIKYVNKNFVYALSDQSQEEIISKFNEKIKIIPVVDKTFKFIDYFELKHGIHLPLAQQDLSQKEFEYLTEAFLSTWISSTGKYIELFENKFSDYCECKYGVSTSNGTTALHLALMALGIGQGDEVIVPDLTFAATINAVFYVGATPVIVDVEADSWGIDPVEIERAITPRTKAIIPVHLYGQPCDMDAIMTIAKRNKLFVIEDCAEAHGAMYDRKKVGSFGDIGCFSFFANKIITTGEGGMCTTNSYELNDKMRVLRDHGMNKSKRYWHDVVGYNYRLTNLQAAIGVAQVERIDEILKKREEVEDIYRKTLLDIKFLEFQPNDLAKRKKITWLVCILINGYDRDDYVQILKQKGLDVRPMFYSLSEMPLYKKYSFSNKNSLNLSRRGICLPTHCKMMEIKKEWFSV